MRGRVLCVRRRFCSACVRQCPFRLAQSNTVDDVSCPENDCKTKGFWERPIRSQSRRRVAAGSPRAAAPLPKVPPRKAGPPHHQPGFVDAIAANTHRATAGCPYAPSSQNILLYTSTSLHPSQRDSRDCVTLACIGDDATRRLRDRAHALPLFSIAAARLRCSL